MILFRYRPDVTGRTTRTVHLASLPEGGWPSTLTALCGILLHAEDVEQVTPNEGVPCALCLVSHIRTLSSAETPTAAPAPGPEGGPFAAEAIYRGVHRVTSCLLLPPTMTPRGSLTWAIPPQPNVLPGDRRPRRSVPNPEFGTTPETTETRPVAG